MARLSSVFVLLFAIATFHYAAAQTSHVVGDGTGWDLPASPNTYSAWASGKTFTVGDTLVFNFVTGRHDVVQVPNRADFNDCSDDNPVGNIITTGPATVTLTTAGEVFFFCNIATHCESGQKLNITVVAATTAPAPPTTTPGSPPTTPSSPSPPPPAVTSTPAAPPPPSSATPVFASGFLTLLALIVAYLH